MKYPKKHIDFWKNQGLKHIKPNTGDEFPEGWDVRNYIAGQCIDEGDTVVEMGCGDGRLAEAFSHDAYIGYDINPKAVALARKQHSNHTFEVYNIGDHVEGSDIILFYTVLLHVPDECLVDFLKTTTANADEIAVCEIMGRKWRRKGNPPVFNRELDEYTDIVKEVGFTGAPFIRSLPYEKYKDTDITFFFSTRG